MTSEQLNSDAELDTAHITTPLDAPQVVDNSSILPDSNITPPAPIVKPSAMPAIWEGDDRYFQTGAKAGTLKPSHRTGGLDAEKANEKAPMFNAAGKVNPEAGTEGATVPHQKLKAGKKRKPMDKAASEIDDKAVALANANMIVTALDLLRHSISGGELVDNPELRSAAVGAWAVYMAEKGIEMPAWVQVGVMSCMYVAPAFSTPNGKAKVTTLWGKIKAWYVLARS